MVDVSICNFIWGFRICNKNEEILLREKVCPIIIDEKAKNTLQFFLWKVKTFSPLSSLDLFFF